MLPEMLRAAQEEGKLRSAAYRILDLTESFLGSGESLLKGLRERLHNGWLSTVLRIVRKLGEWQNRVSDPVKKIPLI